MKPTYKDFVLLTATLLLGIVIGGLITLIFIANLQ